MRYGIGTPSSRPMEQDTSVDPDVQEHIDMYQRQKDDEIQDQVRKQNTIRALRRRRELSPPPGTGEPQFSNPYNPRAKIGIESY